MTRAACALLIGALAGPWTIAQTEAPRQVPLVPGLTVVTAYHLAGVCDCESVKQITAVDASGFKLTYASNVPERGMEGLLGAGRSSSRIRQVNGRRTVRREDLDKATEYMQVFGENLPDVIPGTTALGVSTAVLRDLKTKGRSPLTMRSGGLGAALGGLIGAIAGRELGGIKELGELDKLDKLTGTVVRVEAKTIPVRVLVNDRAVDLPAVHAKGRLGEEDADLHVLDDESNPLALRWALGDNRLQVIKIQYPDRTPGAAAAARIASALAEKGRVEVYGIYFDFDSDVLRPESGPVLTEIAQALVAHPDWRLGVEGHTDNIGTAAHNMDLSTRRAAAVKTALVTRHKVPAARLSTSGFGASRPKDTNDTVEGRARNRRVELVRQ